MNCRRMLGLVLALMVALVGCSSPAPEKHLIIRVKPLVESSASKTLNEYDIIYYEPASSSQKKSVTVNEHDNDLLTGYDIEVHFKRKYGWTKSDVKKVAEETFGWVNDTDFGSMHVKQKKRVICLLIKFDDLDQNKNVQVLVDHDLIRLMGDSNKVDGRMSIGWFVRSLLISGEEISDSRAADIPLHFDVE